MKEIEKNLYRLQIPLPKSPLKFISCYLFRGERRHLLVDTAFNHDICEQALYEQLGKAGAAIEDTDIFITHLHVDHCGLIGRLKRPKNTIYASAQEKRWIDFMQHPDHAAWLEQGNIRAGVPDKYAILANGHVAHRRKSGSLVDITVLREGDRFEIGGFDLEVIELPGHTPGQLGLWEREKKYLFSGDHIMAGVSPNIAAWDLTTDYLDLYLKSLGKVRRMPVAKLFPAHRDAPEDINARIDELKEHHRERTAAIVEVLKNSPVPMTPFDIAILLKWDLKLPILEAPALQLWFACSETLAHLQSLRFKSQVLCKDRECVLYFTCNHENKS